MVVEASLVERKTKITLINCINSVDITGVETCLQSSWNAPVELIPSKWDEKTWQSRREVSCLYIVQLFKVINFQSFSTRHVLKLRLKQCIVTNTHAQFKNDSKKKEPIQKMIHRAKTVNPRRTTLMPIKLPQLACSIQLHKRSIIVDLVKAKFSLNLYS